MQVRVHVADDQDALPADPERALIAGLRELVGPADADPPRPEECSDSHSNTSWDVMPARAAFAPPRGGRQHRPQQLGRDRTRDTGGILSCGHGRATVLQEISVGRRSRLNSRSTEERHASTPGPTDPSGGLTCISASDAQIADAAARGAGLFGARNGEHVSTPLVPCSCANTDVSPALVCRVVDTFRVWLSQTRIVLNRWARVVRSQNVTVISSPSFVAVAAAVDGSRPRRRRRHRARDPGHDEHEHHRGGHAYLVRRVRGMRSLPESGCLRLSRRERR